MRNDKTLIAGVTLIVLGAMYLVALFLFSLLFVLLGMNIGGKRQ